MLISRVSHAMERLVQMGFDTVTVHFDVKYRSILAVNHDTGEAFRITPTRPSRITPSTAYWADYGWAWELHNEHGHFIAGQSCDDWMLSDVLESIDTYGV